MENKEDIFNFNDDIYTDFNKTSDLNHYTYILQYFCYGNKDKGIRDFINNYLKENCLFLTTLGNGGAGGITFVTNININELTRVLRLYDLEYILYQINSGKYSYSVSEENAAIYDEIFKYKK